MFLSACREVSKEFPDVAYDEDLLDRVCLQVGIRFDDLHPSFPKACFIDSAKP